MNIALNHFSLVLGYDSLSKKDIKKVKLEKSDSSVLNPTAQFRNPKCCSGRFFVHRTNNNNDNDNDNNKNSTPNAN